MEGLWHMKILFNDKSYIDCQSVDNGSKIIITISAKEQGNALKKIVNSVEITKEQFKQLISDLSI